MSSVEREQPKGKTVIRTFIMVFKPFRPPLIRNRPAQSKPADDAGEEQASHPAKRRRVSTDRDDDPEVDDIKPQAGKTGSNLTSRPQLTSRKPLLQVTNLHVDAAEDSSNNHDDNENNAAKTDDIDGVEGYYNVLWFVSTCSLLSPSFSALNRTV